MNKRYLEIKTNLILNRGIDELLQTLQAQLAEDPNSYITHLCYEIGVLTALKNQAKDIIQKL